MSAYSRLAVLSMHTSPTAALGQSANGGMNVYVREVCSAFSACGIATDVFTHRQRADDPRMEQIAPLSRVIYVDSGPAQPDKYGLLEQVPAFADGVLRHFEELGIEPTALYSHYWLSGAAAMRLQPVLGLPWIHTAHTLGLIKNRQLAPGAAPEPASRIEVERLIAKGAHLQIASTEAESEDLVGLYEAAPDRVQVVAPGVDLGTFGPMSKKEARGKIGYPDQRLLLFVGRLERLKGVEVVLRALALIGVRQFPDLRLLILGEDSLEGAQSEKDRLRGIAAELGISDRVDFLGPVAHHELPYFYAAAEALLMPSYSESFGLVGLEAQACGCPVIAANVAGLASVVRDEVTGFLVDGYEPADYAQRIGSLLQDPDLAAQLSRRSIVLAQRYPWQLTADRLWSAIGPLVEPASQERLAQRT